MKNPLDNNLIGCGSGDLHLAVEELDYGEDHCLVVIINRMLSFKVRNVVSCDRRETKNLFRVSEDFHSF